MLSMEALRELIEAARPYLPGLPPEVELVPWRKTGLEDPRYLGLAFRDRPAVALRPGLEGEALERVILHELLHLAEPLLSEAWTRALEPVLHYALKAGLPPRDVPSLAWVSPEELAGCFSGLPEAHPLFPGKLASLWQALGVMPTPGLEEDPLYIAQQIAGGLPFGTTLWALERLWAEPPLTRRRAALEVAWWAATALEEDWQRLLALLGRGEEFPESRVQIHPVHLWHIPIAEGRRSLTLSLVEAVLEGPGESYTPPEAGLPEEVVAGLIAQGGF